MASVNKFIGIGNMVIEPESAVTNSGVNVCKGCIAINEKYGDKETANFIPFKAFGQLADVIMKHGFKGQPVYIEGKLNIEKWEDKEGRKQSRPMIMLNQMQFLAWRQRDGAQPQQRQSYSQAGTQKSQHQETERVQSIAEANANVNNDIPF